MYIFDDRLSFRQINVRLPSLNPKLQNSENFSTVEKKVLSKSRTINFLPNLHPVASQSA